MVVPSLQQPLLMPTLKRILPLRKKININSFSLKYHSFSFTQSTEAKIKKNLQVTACQRKLSSTEWILKSRNVKGKPQAMEQSYLVT